MDKKKLLGIAEATAPLGKRRLETHSQAETAREKGEIESLYAAYEKAVEERYEAEEALGGFVNMCVGKSGTVGRDDIHAVKAMRDVALAAIDLAKQMGVRHDD